METLRPDPNLPDCESDSTPRLSDSASEIEVRIHQLSEVTLSEMCRFTLAALKGRARHLRSLEQQTGTAVRGLAAIMKQITRAEKQLQQALKLEALERKYAQDRDQQQAEQIAGEYIGGWRRAPRK